MSSKTAILAFGTTLLLAASGTVANTGQASAQEDCRVYREGSGARAACDARLSEWMIQQNKKIMREGANGGCGNRCEEDIAARNRAARKFESNSD